LAQFFVFALEGVRCALAGVFLASRGEVSGHKVGMGEETSGFPIALIPGARERKYRKYE